MTSAATTMKATCWSLTIFNKDETKTQLPPGWSLVGQWEQCPKTEKVHLQAMLKTNHVRFSAVKKVFPTAHIEKARNPMALEEYVGKEETRVAEFKTVESPNVFQLQTTVCTLWDDEEWNKLRQQEIDKKHGIPDIGDCALRYVDKLVGQLIASGTPGAEFTGVNPMWRSAWKRFYSSILVRHRQTDRQTDTASENTEIETPAVVESIDSPAEEETAEED